AGGEDGGGAFAGGDGVEGLVEVPELDAFGSFRDGGGAEVPGGADDRSRLGQGVRGVGAWGAAVAADHGDLGLHAAGSAIFCWPVKSTMMTRTRGGSASGPAISALNRLSTRAARAHSSRPAAGSRPAWSQSSAACRAVLALPTCPARSSGPPAALVMSLSRA